MLYRLCVESASRAGEGLPPHPGRHAPGRPARPSAGRHLPLLRRPRNGPFLISKRCSTTRPWPCGASRWRDRVLGGGSVRRHGRWAWSAAWRRPSPWTACSPPPSTPTAHHREGATYIWPYRRDQGGALAGEFKRFAAVYRLPEKGNFDGAIHLTRARRPPARGHREKAAGPAPPAAAARPRRQDPLRPQRPGRLRPGAGRASARPARTGTQGGADRGQEASRDFLGRISLSHCLAGGTVQKQGFLERRGRAAPGRHHAPRKRRSAGLDPMNALARYVVSFRSERPLDRIDLADFQAVPASWFDHPMPSAVSLAAMGLARAAVLGAARRGRNAWSTAAPAVRFFQRRRHDRPGPLSPDPSRGRRSPGAGCRPTSIQVRDRNGDGLLPGPVPAAGLLIHHGPGKMTGIFLLSAAGPPRCRNSASDPGGWPG